MFCSYSLYDGLNTLCDGPKLLRVAALLLTLQAQSSLQHHCIATLLYLDIHCDIYSDTVTQVCSNIIRHIIQIKIPFPPNEKTVKINWKDGKSKKIPKIPLIST